MDRTIVPARIAAMAHGGKCAGTAGGGSGGTGAKEGVGGVGAAHAAGARTMAAAGAEAHYQHLEGRPAAAPTPA
jgi:hypothetical protein